MKTSTFTYDGRTLEVRAVLSEEEWSVRVFENDNQTSLAVYSSTTEIVRDANLQGLDIVECLMETAQQDFIRWSDEMK